MCVFQDTLSTECDSSENCRKNCCVSMVIAPIYFVVFVLMAQFVLVNVVVAVLMKHLEVRKKHTFGLIYFKEIISPTRPFIKQYLLLSSKLNKQRFSTLFGKVQFETLFTFNDLRYLTV